MDDTEWVPYASVSEATRIIGETHSVDINKGNISAVVNGKITQTAGFVFKKDESRALPEVLEGEVWKPSQDGTSVSNMQRFKNAKGHIYVPNLNSGENYVRVKIKGQTLQFHRLVCEAFHGPMPLEGGIRWTTSTGTQLTTRRKIYGGRPNKNNV